MIPQINENFSFEGAISRLSDHFVSNYGTRVRGHMVDGTLVPVSYILALCQKQLLTIVMADASCLQNKKISYCQQIDTSWISFTFFFLLIAWISCVMEYYLRRFFSHMTLSENTPFLSPAHDIVITMSGRASVRPCFVSGLYIGNRLMTDDFEAIIDFK